MSEALFRSAHQALLYAYTFSATNTAQPRLPSARSHWLRVNGTSARQAAGEG